MTASSVALDWRADQTARMTRPETPGEAAEWTSTFNAALEIGGLCATCAAHFAYGVQHGFSRVAHPCADCGWIVATFPEVVGNGWRRPQGRVQRASAWCAWRSARTADVPGPITHDGAASALPVAPEGHEAALHGEPPC